MGRLESWWARGGEEMAVPLILGCGGFDLCWRWAPVLTVSGLLGGLFLRSCIMIMVAQLNSSEYTLCLVVYRS